MDVPTFIGHGWLLGTYKWTYPLPVEGEFVEDSLTALLDKAEHDPRDNAGLVPVRRSWRRYKVLEGSFRDRYTVSPESLPRCRDVVQAVKRLAGEPN